MICLPPSGGGGADPIVNRVPAPPAVGAEEAVVLNKLLGAVAPLDPPKVKAGAPELGGRAVLLLAGEAG